MSQNEIGNNHDAAATAERISRPVVPQGVVVVVTMRPDRVIGGVSVAAGTAEEGSPKAAKAAQAGSSAQTGKTADAVSKRFRTTNWYFASDFLDRLAELADGECSLLKVRPVEVEIRFAVDEKAYRHVDLIFDSFDRVFAAL